MINYKDLTKDYIKISKRWGVERDGFPLSTRPDNHGQEHIEISDGNTASLVTTERGKVTKERKTTSKDEVLYWVFADEAYGKGWGYSMKNRVKGEDFRRAAFKHALAEISKLRDEWAERFETEIEEILRANPFDDD